VDPYIHESPKFATFVTTPSSIIPSSGPLSCYILRKLDAPEFLSRVKPRFPEFTHHVRQSRDAEIISNIFTYVYPPDQRFIPYHLSDTYFLVIRDLFNNTISFRMNRRIIKGLALALIEENPALCSNAFARTLDFPQSLLLLKKPFSVLCFTMSPREIHRYGHIRQQFHGRSIQLDPDIIDAVLPQ